MHPVLQAFIDAQGQRGNYAANLGREFANVGRNLPPARIAFPPQRASYEGSDRWREIFSYLGTPVKKPVRER
jgi:hypothetical protein